MIISLDSETGGVDLVHGAMPFLITTCADDGEIRFWEWPINPLTRRPDIPGGDLEAIAELLDTSDLIYLQNAKFDARALLNVGIQLPWDRVRDTLAMGHLLASNHPHDLTWMCMAYLGADIEPHELHVKEVTQACRAIAKRDHPTWRIADEGLPEMPSVKSSSKRDEDKPWKNDMWLPRALAKHYTDLSQTQFVNKDWLTACSKYANADSEHTLPLGLEMERIIRERGYWSIYMERNRLPHIACDMECYGVTAIGEYTERTIGEYEEHVAEAESELVAIAAEYGHELELAAGASINDNMREFFYGSIKQSCPKCSYTNRVKHWAGDTHVVEACPKCLNRKRSPATHQLNTVQNQCLKLPVIYGKNGSGACLDKDVMKEYLTTTDGSTYDFIKLLTDKRKHDTDLTYMQAYRRFWVPMHGAPGYYRVHPSLNPFATDHLRWASNSPNLQNVGSQEDACEECEGEGKDCAWCNGTGRTRISVRNCFGPAPSREWWTMDYKSIEARIPAYESGELKMVEVFEKPNEAPYWGNLYNLTASVLYPQEYWPLANVEGEFRKRHPRLYKRAKFFVLAKNYGAGRRKGDLLSGVKDSYDLVDNEFPLLAKLQAHYLTCAERDGYVETIPDREVDSERGYPILASRTDNGRVLSTTPFNYHVSGTACWVKNRALVKCSEQLRHWRREGEGFDGHIALEVHDEILFDFPRAATVEEGDNNRTKAMALKGLMESCGIDGIGIPCPVAVEWHPKSWAEGVAI